MLASTAVFIVLAGGCSSTTQKQSSDTSTDRFYIGTVKPMGKQSKKPVSLSIVADQSGYLLCFYEDENNRIMRFFPNRFHASAYVEKNVALDLPGDMPFTVTSSIDAVERVACFLTQTDVLSQLPAEIKDTDFTALPYDMPMITTFFRRITASQYLYTEVTI